MWQRRTWLAAAAATATLPLVGCGSPPVQGFADIAAARKAIAGLVDGSGTVWRSSGAFNLAQMLNHAAQNVEYSMNGFPELKSALFRKTAGAAAFAFFDARGAMSHALSDPIPGAPVLAADAALDVAAQRALRALQDFEAHSGALAPHFAFGALDKARFTRAHLMHIANHWTAVVRA